MSEITIVQIAQTTLGITGLGSDNKLYVWNSNINDWSPAK